MEVVKIGRIITNCKTGRLGFIPAFYQRKKLLRNYKVQAPLAQPFSKSS